MVTKAMYSMVSLLNQPDFTAYSPSTIPAMTLRGVVSMLGSVYGRQPQAVDGEFQDKKLPYQGYV